MNNQTDLIVRLMGDCARLLIEKSKAYNSGTGDFLNAFKVASEMTGVPVHKVILVRISDKLARLASLVRYDTPILSNENIEDTMKDMINYLVLMYLSLQDAGLQEYISIKDELAHQALDSWNLNPEESGCDKYGHCDHDNCCFCGVT